MYTHTHITHGDTGVGRRDMEYVMLHLIFIYLMPGEGQPAAYAASDL